MSDAGEFILVGAVVWQAVVLACLAGGFERLKRRVRQLEDANELLAQLPADELSAIRDARALGCPPELVPDYLARRRG